ncbi:PTS-dependent dihydroxyacetone kinase 1, dihydroxyacetone-binding subunit DhaK-like isoform X2 [Lycorma delicatula]|uniref:PTS-dependent dihydroxyacetone kinase 1, dihydroxyacetone-binding subunit DhaK-like isoform X2 n=1 Tax=Lycorma delicatula TaxID=130591 RepID=UPI003F516371
MSTSHSACYTPHKKIINSPSFCVQDMLEGIRVAYPGLSVNLKSGIIMRYDEPENVSDCVGIVSGGGSGHEPYCAGGVLVLVLNYTGDRLNFGQAIEVAKDEGIKVESVTVGDDLALYNAVVEKAVGRRGLSGMLFVLKIAGALATAGKSLEHIANTCRQIIVNFGTVGICSSPCTVPGAPTPLFTLPVHQLEFGVGIHGEAGVSKINLRPASEIVDILIRKIVNSLILKYGDEVCVIINNLGGSSQMEGYIVGNEVNKLLEKKGVIISRLYIGTFMTSLEMGGIQISLLRTTGHADWLEHLDAYTEASAWPSSVLLKGKTTFKIADMPEKPVAEYNGPIFEPKEADIFRKCLYDLAICLPQHEERLNKLDSGCGDGDCGTTFKMFTTGIIEVLDELPCEKPGECFTKLADIASERMGGTSGSLYSLMLRGAARYVPDWLEAWKNALQTVKKYTPVKVGYRCMMDALIPAYKKFESSIAAEENLLHSLKEAVLAAQIGCENTRNMKALIGRAAYVEEKYQTDIDAGAFAVTLWLESVHNTLSAVIK